MFANDVKNLCREFEEAGNSFSDKSNDLYTLDTKHIMPDTGNESIESAEDTGRVQFIKFLSERLRGNSTPFFDAITKNNLPLFNSILEKTITISAIKSLT